MLTIHDFEGFPNPARVRIAIKEKGLQDRVAFNSIDVLNGAHRDPAFIAKNPAGTVPVLELEDGATISECTAITEYLDHLDGAPELTGRTARQRGEIHMMNRRAEADLLDAVGDYFHNATEGLGPELETDQTPEWGVKRRAKAEKAMRYFDDLLRSRRYLAGDEFSMADITAYCGLGFADFAGVPIPEDAAALREWRARMAERPAFA